MEENDSFDQDFKKDPTWEPNPYERMKHCASVCASKKKTIPTIPPKDNTSMTLTECAEESLLWEEEENDSSDEEEKKDPIWKPYLTPFVKKKITCTPFVRRKKCWPVCASKLDSLSAYEKKRQENIKANEEFLSKLGMFEAKKNLRLSLKKRKSKPKQRGIKRVKPPPIPPTPRQSSVRLKRLNPTGDPLTDIPELLVLKGELKRPAGPINMTDYLYSDTQEHDCLRKKMQTLSRTNLEQSAMSCMSDSTLSSIVNEFGETRLSAERVVQVVPGGVFSVAFHPTLEKVLVAAGSGKLGKLGIWDVEDVNDNQNGVVIYRPHSRPVSHVTFSSYHPDRLYSCSYDGSLRCAYFDKGIFEDVYSLAEEENVSLSNFEFISPDTMLVSQNNGCVALVDQRARGTGAESVYSLHERYMRTVSIHPVDKHYFITACVSGKVSLWDRRKLKDGAKKKNISLDVLPHGKSVNSAYFSPITGNYILTTSLDDRLGIFDSSSISTGISLKTAIRHNNQVGHLTGFRASWHPAREDLFVVGSMDIPKQIEMYGIDGTLLKALKDEEWLGSVCSLNAIHPSRNIVAGGISNGRVHVFM